VAESFDELLKRDAQRESDGFHRKIKTRRILAGPNRIINIPFVEEEKLVHGNFEPNGEHGRDEAGHGEGEAGDVIKEIPLEGNGDDAEKGDQSGGPGGEGEEDHGIESEAYELGRQLSEKFKLPNLKDKSKKIPTSEFTYDLTDRHRGSGQFLDKKPTIVSIIKTNAALGRIDIENIDPTQLIVGRRDKVYRILSKEKVWKSQAVVFFIRDYSGSMQGDRTKTVISQHSMISNMKKW
jgi:uncharacterized sporulation protein YeaH/YhbH (DUF444 family)